MLHIECDTQVSALNSILAPIWMRKHNYTAIIGEEMSQYFNTALYFGEILSEDLKIFHKTGLT